ncbi:MAG: hypothetical protein ACRERD_17510 [Candidatus Binatia bacterium]
MNKLLGLGATALSVMIAAVFSGLRLQPYLAAGQSRTPPEFALYPVLIAAAIAVPVVLIFRKWQGKPDVDIGPVTLADKQPFIVLGCLLYMTVAVIFFPYQKPPKVPFPSQRPGPEELAPADRPIGISLPLSG